MGATPAQSTMVTSTRRRGVESATVARRAGARTAGPSPNAIGEEHAVRIFVHVARSLGRAFLREVHAGALVGGALRVEDSGGGEVADHGYDPAPFVAATFAARL